MKENNFLLDNICHICFLYHFDLGSEYLINGIRKHHEKDRTPNFLFSDLRKKIEETIGNELIKIRSVNLQNS